MSSYQEGNQSNIPCDLPQEEKPTRIRTHKRKNFFVMSNETAQDNNHFF